MVLATPAPAAAAAAPPPRRRGRRPAGRHRLRVGRAGDVPRRNGGLPPTLVGTGFLVPRRSPHKGRDLGGDGVHLPGPQVAAPRRDGEACCAPRSGASTTPGHASGATTRSPTGPGSELGALMGVTGQPIEARVVRFDNAFPQYRVHHLLRTAGIESAVARLGGVAVAGAAYRGVGIPACIASGRARPPRTRSCERPAAPGPRRRPLGRGGRPARALAAPVGLVAPGPHRRRAALLAPGRPVVAGPRSGPVGWPVWAATPSGSSGPGPSTGTAPSCSSWSRRSSSRPRRRPRRHDVAGPWPSSPPAPWPKPSACTWPFGGLPLGGVFLGQAAGPLVELARLGGPLLITAGVWAGGVGVATLSTALWRRGAAGTAAPGRLSGRVIAGGIAALAVVGTARARRRCARRGRCGWRWSRGAGNGA